MIFCLVKKRLFCSTVSNRYFTYRYRQSKATDYKYINAILKVSLVIAIIIFLLDLLSKYYRKKIKEHCSKCKEYIQGMQIIDIDKKKNPSENSIVDKIDREKTIRDYQFEMRYYQQGEYISPTHYIMLKSVTEQDYQKILEFIFNRKMDTLEQWYKYLKNQDQEETKIYNQLIFFADLLSFLGIINIFCQSFVVFILPGFAIYGLLQEILQDKTNRTAKVIDLNQNVVIVLSLILITLLYCLFFGISITNNKFHHLNTLKVITTVIVTELLIPKLFKRVYDLFEIKLETQPSEPIKTTEQNQLQA